MAASLEETFGRVTGRAQITFRRTGDVLWRPLRNLTRADYAVSGGAIGALFGQDYNVAAFAPVTTTAIVPGNGRVLTNRPDYRQDALTLEAEARGPLGARGRFRLWGAYLDWRERFLDRTTAIQDPTPLDIEALVDGGRIAPRPGGVGRGDLFVGARWTAGAEATLPLPARFEGALVLQAREGFPVPYFQATATGDPTAGTKNVLVTPEQDSYRLPALVLLDARLARRLAVGRGEMVVGLDVFNVLDRTTRLQAGRDVGLPLPGRARETLGPRIARIGIEYRF
jgi:hypothetical protein